MSNACLVLAAGRGSRIGGRNKALLRFGEMSFLERITLTCYELEVREILVVVGQPHAASTRAEAQRLQIETITNARPALGMASSVAIGFQQALRRFESSHCWLWPVDSPAVSAHTLQRLSAMRQGADILIPCVAGRGGHPSLVARSVWPELAGCAALAEGARTVFRRDPGRVLRVAVEDALAVVDVDLEEDLEKLA